MVVEIVSVGTELLLGNIINTNAAYLAQKCAELGMSCFYQTVVGDNRERLRQTLQTALNRSDIVILGGGLGPTGDDLTKETVAELMGEKLVEDTISREWIEKFFQSRGILMTENNMKQALTPEHALILYNENGTAPGYIMEKDGKHVILLPGPPNECIPMFEKDVYSYLSKLSPYVIYSKMVKLCGIGESLAETRIEDLIKTQTNPTIATYAKTGEVHIRVTACAENEDMARKLVKPTIKILKERFGDRIYTTKNKETLEASVVKLLSKNDLTITTAESCTGGLLSGRLINVPGASDVLKSAYITYSDKAKQRILRVKRFSLEKNTAVSEQVAAEMAAGAVRAAGADVAVSVTGLAGPDGGTDENPVGTVYIGCSVGDSTVVKKYCFLGNRDKIRESAVVAALTLVREEVMLFLERIKN